MKATLEPILQDLRDRGFRLTPQRERIVAILWSSTTPLTAREVHEEVQKDFPNVSLDTVYRNLQLLRETGLAGQINLQHRESARFELQRDGHHHHLVCLDCGEAACLYDCPIDLDAVKEAMPDFKVIDHAFELYGYCAKCQA